MLIDLHENRTAIVRLHQSSFVVSEICSELCCSDSMIKSLLEAEYDLWLQTMFCNVQHLSAIEFKEHLKQLAMKLLKEELNSEFKQSSKSRKTVI